MSKREFKKPPAKQGQRILAPETAGHELEPAFGFYACAPGYGLADLTDEDALIFLEHIHRRSQMTWGGMHDAWYKKLGYEPIPRGIIRVPIPAILTPDKTIYALRCGGLRRLIGFREGRVFVVVWLDPNGSVYPHGS